jgi:hypothetical protein
MLVVAAIAGGVFSVLIYRALYEIPSSHPLTLVQSTVAPEMLPDLEYGKIILYPDRIKVLFHKGGDGRLKKEELRKLLGNALEDTSRIAFYVLKFEPTPGTWRSFHDNALLLGTDHALKATTIEFTCEIVPISLGDLRMKYPPEKEPLIDAIYHATGAKERPHVSKATGNPPHWRAFPVKSSADRAETILTPAKHYNTPAFRKGLIDLLPRMSIEDHARLERELSALSRGNPDGDKMNP